MNLFGNINNLYLQANKSNKYSNDTLFSRRETEYPSKIRLPIPSSKITSTINRPYSSSIKTTVFNQQKSIISKYKRKSAFLNQSTKSNLKRVFHEENYFYRNNSKSYKSKLQSFIDLERNYNPKVGKKKWCFRKNINVLTNICTDSNLNYVSSLYLTETDTKKKPFMVRDFITNNNKDNSLEITNYNYTNHLNADILTKFMNDRLNFNLNENLKTEYKDKMTSNKNKKINMKRESNHEFREKIRKLKIYKSILKAKEELSIRIQEKYQNTLGFLNDKIESFNTWKKLNKEFFSYKIDEYLKFLMYQKSYEKNKVEDLEEDIITIKNEINKINSKIGKIELEKSRVIRWIYFQIQLKEKKVILPDYYNLVLENINEISIFYETRKKHLASSMALKNTETAKTINSLSMSTIKKKEKLKKSFKKPKMFAFLDNNKTPNLKNEFINFLNKKEGKEVYNIIKEYKNNLIYTAEEFYDRISNLERENLQLMEYHTNLKYKIQDLRTQYERVVEQNNKIFKGYYESLNAKESELIRLKANNSTMENIVKIFNNLNYYKNNKQYKGRKSLFDDEKEEKDEPIIYMEPIPQIAVNKKIKKNKSKNKNKKKKINKELLFDKVEKLYNLCKKIKFKDEKNYEVLKEKEKMLKNFGFLFSIFYIEYSVNYLVTYARNFELNNKDGKKKMRKILFDIEKAHREEKAAEMRKQRLLKHLNLEKLINEKSNKVYFHNKQINIAVKKKKKKIEIKREKTPSFDDFLFNNSSEDFNLYH